jgi:hypothetical protein
LIPQYKMSCFGNEYMSTFLAFNVRSQVATKDILITM